jgi:hypothetical protein
VAFSAGFVGLRRLVHAGSFLVDDPAGAGSLRGVGYGVLVPDPAGVIDLPEGFRYAIISRQGQTMDDGLLVPGLHDGMGAFAGENGKTIVVRNHEIEADWSKYSAFGRSSELLPVVDAEKLYDPGAVDEQGVRRPGLGGTTTLVFDTKTQRLEKHFLSLAGTNRNCAGGPTPWGTWLSCEEDSVRAGEKLALHDHGYVFEVPASATVGLVKPVPIKAMGRFVHEAVAIDPRTGIVYMSEDQQDGVLYRYIPAKPGVLLAGGKLQALCVRDVKSCDTSNSDTSPAISVGEKLAAAWIDVDDIDSPKNDLRLRAFAAGAARFARGEGMWWGDGCVFFAATTGGRAKKGQIFRYTPSDAEGTNGEVDRPGVLELFVEPNDGKKIENADNITVSPWGDLVVCEDGVGEEVEPSNRLLGITPAGQPYTLARNALSNSELSGACFSPDGTTLFVNIQRDGMTLAITGPWKRRGDT